MGPTQFQAAMRARGFVMEASGRWHGPFGLLIQGTYNDTTTTSLADRIRDEQLRQVDAAIAARRRDYNSK